MHESSEPLTFDVDRSCELLRPNWDGIPVSEFEQALHLAHHPISLVLFLVCAASICRRSLLGSAFVAVCGGVWLSHILLTEMLNDLVYFAIVHNGGCIGYSGKFVFTFGAVIVLGFAYNLALVLRDFVERRAQPENER